MRESSPRRLRNFVDGAFVAAASDVRSDIVNPATGQVVATAAVSSSADVDAAYAAAARAFESWRDTTPGEWQRALLKIADAIEARADELVRLESENTGKPYALTTSEEIPPMVDQIRFFAGAARVLEGRAMRMSRRLDFGCVWINTHIPLVAEMPHGGFKNSGYGKDLSMYGFEDYARVKHVMADIG